MEYFNLGNDVVNLIAIVDGSDNILRFDPIKGNADGSLYVLNRYPFIDSPSNFYTPFVADVSDYIDAGSDSYGLLTASVNYLYNEDDDELQRERNNDTITLLNDATRSASIDSEVYINYNSKGGHFIINVSAIAVDATITVTVQGADPNSLDYYDILVGTTISTIGVHVLKVYPGIGQIPNGSASDILPRFFRVSVLYGGTDTIAYAVVCSLVV